MIPRRAFVAGLAAALLAGSGAAAQQGERVSRIGILLVARPQMAEWLRELYSKRFRELGWQDGGNFRMDIRHTIAPDQTGELAFSLVAAKPDVLIAVGPYSAHSLKEATDTIPIVLAAVADPVSRGLVASLARPGGNITGVSHLAGTGFDGKERQILSELLPRAERFALLRNPRNRMWAHFPIRERLDVLRRERGITLDVVEVGTVDDVPPAIERAARLGAKGVIVTADAVFHGAQQRIIELTAKHKLPAIYPDRSFVSAGGLVSYGTAYRDMFLRSADYVDKILRGTKPADLPIEQPSRFELVINLKTAKMLNLTIPPSLLLRADQVIE